MGTVTVQTVTSIEVGKFLISKGLTPATCSGVALSSLGNDTAVGILASDPYARPEKHLFGLITKPQRKRFVGTVWFSNEVRGASEGNWVLEVNGTCNQQFLKELADEMALRFETNIALRLGRTESLQEPFWDDE